MEAPLPSLIDVQSIALLLGPAIGPDSLVVLLTEATAFAARRALFTLEPAAVFTCTSTGLVLFIATRTFLLITSTSLLALSVYLVVA